jgi:DNA-binding MarR family transcriptional regulator
MLDKMTSVTTTDHARLLADDRITAFGLLVEANRRLLRTLERSLRDHHGLSVVAFEALLRLGRSADHHMSMSELADQMVLTSGGVTRLVDRLASEQLVERVACPTDRRVHWARLTEAGLERVTAALGTHLDDLEEHFSSLMSADELGVLTDVLDRLRGGEPPPGPPAST